ncbi:cation:proton antiporter domain-containing protein [Aurantivibrio infirmus]
MGHVLTQILILLGSAAALTTLFYRLHVPALLAFLLVGLACGPTGLKVVEDPEELRAVAELGLAFLLFLLGLEFSLPRLIALRHTVLRVGGAQVLVCTLAFSIAFYWWGLTWETALVVSGGLALSSTAIVSRELAQLGQLQQRHGQIAIGVLLFQDIVAIVLLIAVPLLAAKEVSDLAVSDDANSHSSILIMFKDIGLPILKSAGLLVFFFFSARFLLPKILAEVARSRSDELLVLSALVIVLVAGLLTSAIGLSMELGAFLAGMMLGDSRFKHQLEADVRPFRDLLLGLFFISIGMLIDIGMLQEYWLRIIASGIALLIFKAAIITCVAKLLGETWRAALPAGLALAQGGEFLFALLALATRDNFIASDVASFLLAVTIVSMALTPILIRHAGELTEWLLRKFQKNSTVVEPESTLLSEKLHKQQHVIILGFGRVGQTIARFLKKLDLEYIALETDTVRIAEAQAAGEPVYYGNAARADMLKAAGIAKAALLVISFDDTDEALQILRTTQQEFPTLPVLTRTGDDSSLDALINAGATEVVPETLEASLMLVQHVLLMLHVPSKKIHEVIDEVRHSRYKILHGFYHGERIKLLNNKDRQPIVKHAVKISEDSWACGKRIPDLNWAAYSAGSSGEEFEIEYSRNEKPISKADYETITLQVGDIIIMQGTMEQVDSGEGYLLAGR